MALALTSLAGRKPTVLALAGLPGAGKSTLAQALSALTSWPVIDRDRLRAEAWPDDASAEARQAADRLLLRRVGTGARAGLSLIVDGKTYASATDRALLNAEVEEAGAELQWIWLDLAAEQACARIAAQVGHPAPDRDAALVAQVARRFEPLSSAAWRLDASCSAADLLEQVVALLAGRLRALVIE